MTGKFKRFLSMLLMVAMFATLVPSLGITVAAEKSTSGVSLLASGPTIIQSDTKENTNQAGGIVYTKTSTAKSDGTIDITLTAHTTGVVKQTNSVTPTDIVLVLDVSGSMGQNYTTTRITGYNAATGGEYTYTEWVFIVPIQRTAYGMDDTGRDYYINTGTEEKPEYTLVTYTGRDSNGFEMYEYSVGNTAVIVYPVLSGVSATRANSYDVVQFYTATTESQTVKKMKALQDAVNSFIDTTARMNTDLETSQMHNISIVKFADNSYHNSTVPTVTEGNHKGADGRDDYNYSEVVKNLTPVDAAGATALKNAVNSLEPGGATAVDFGLNLAQTVLMNRSEVVATGAVDRNEVVIVFTDGSPTYSSDFSNTVANNAITIAGNMESAADVTVYGVCIDTDADATDLDENINKFMHYMTSNFPNATSMTSAGEGGSIENGYYMTPHGDMTLTMIFESIIQEIDHPTISMGEEATMVDTLSPYFDFQNGSATNVKLQTSAKKADGTWADPVDEAGLTHEIVEDRLVVSGFDFDANYISETGRGDNGDFYGKRLVVSFTVVPDYGVIDAASVTLLDGVLPTNSGFASLVDSNDTSAADVETPVLSAHQVVYKVDGQETVSYNRFTGADVTVDAAPTKEGYTFTGWTRNGSPINPEDVFTMPDEDVEIIGTFEVNKYDVKYVYGNTPAGASALPQDQTDVAYGTEVTVAPEASAPGYVFSGWVPLEQDVTVSDGKFTMPDHSVTLRGVFAPDDNTSYTVEHYLETMTDGQYTKHETETKTGVTDTTATAIAKKFEGFTYDEGNPNEVVSGTISASTHLVLKLYYNRDEYDVTYYYAGDIPDNAPTLPTVATYKYGQDVTVANNVSAEGYTFGGWESVSVTAQAGETFKMPAHPVAFIGEFNANSNTLYKVEYYLENLEGDGYDLEEEAGYTGEGVTNSTATAINKTFAGFEFDANNANNKLSGTIAGDGSLVLKLYYKRNTYTVTYAYDGNQPTGAPELPTDNNTYKYGATVTVADALELEGYVFDGWYPTNLAIQIGATFTMPAGNVTLLGNFEPSAGTKWVEEHYFEDLDGNYIKDDNYTVSHTGTTGKTAEATPIAEVEGFTFAQNHADNVISATIEANGSTVLKFHYKRNTYTVTYAYEGEQPAGAPELPTDDSEYKFGETVTIADDLELTGYVFAGWYSSGHTVESEHTTFTMPARDVTLYGDFEPASGVVWTEEHYFEDLYGDYVINDAYTFSHTGTTGNTATATPIAEVEGFTFDQNHADNVVSATIEADGSTVLMFHYKRNTYTVTYAYEGEQPAGAPELPTDDSEYKYGETVTIADDLSMTGYVFVGWYSSGHTVESEHTTFTMPARYVTLYGDFEPSAGIEYKEIHYLQNLDGTYNDAEVYYEKTHYGTTGEEVSAARMNPVGFTFDENAANVESSTIAADGSTVLKFHYKRNLYTVTYKYDPAEQPAGADGLLPPREDFRYGERVAVADAPELTGYVFEGWYPEKVGIPASGTFTMPEGNVVFVGNFNPRSDTKYEVHHHLMMADGNYPAEPNYVNEHAGTTGTEVTAIPRNFAGYVLASTDPVKGIVRADGKLVLDLFYDRIKYNVTYYVTGRVPENYTAPVDTNSYRHGEEVTVLPTPVAPQGITFVGWKPVAQSDTDANVTINGGKFTMPMHNVRLEGRFSADSGIPYVINHWVEKETLGSYEIYTSDRRVGTTGDEVTAYAYTIPGFTDVTDYTGGTPGQISETVLGNGSLVINFYYDRNGHTVAYQYDGIVPNGAPTAPAALNDVHFGTDVTVATAPIVPGFTFSGWTTADATVENGVFEMPDKNVVFKGSFTSNEVEYKVNYWFQKVDAGTEFDAADYVLDASSYSRIALTGQHVEAEPKEHVGFHVNPAHSKAYGHVTVDENGVGNLVLDIYFDRNIYDVTYGYYGEQPAEAPALADKNKIGVRYGATVDVESKPQLDGYSFDGWYTHTASVESNKFTMPDHNVEFLGRFVTQYAVGYDLNGGTGAEGVDYSTKAVEAGSDITVNAAPTRNGYNFKGWEESDVVYNPGDTAKVERNMMFVAKWSRKGSGGGTGGPSVARYTLTYETNGGNALAKETHNSGKEVVLTKVPVKKGFAFEGWYLDAELTQHVTEVKMTKDITVYASWVEDNGNAGHGHSTPGSLNGEEHFAYVIGYPDDTVRPNDNISRAEVTTIFFRLLKEGVRSESLSEENDFGDVKNGQWHNMAISSMAKLGIVKGRTKDAFVPDAFITRAEFAVICARFDDSEFEVADNFTDVDGHWAAEEIHEAAAHGWIRGYEDGTFKPDQHITRAEAITMINRVLNRIPESAEDLLDSMTKWSDNSDTGAWYYLQIQEATNSHNYKMKNNIYEKWTALLANRDWTEYQN